MKSDIDSCKLNLNYFVGSVLGSLLMNLMVIIVLFYQQVAQLIGADPREIIFTSGATESNNIAVKGCSRFYKAKKKHVITTQTVSF